MNNTQKMDEIHSELLAALKLAMTEAEIEALRVHYLGRKGIITNLMRTIDMSQLSEDERRVFGKRFNKLKNTALEDIDQAMHSIRQKGTDRFGIFDLTIPGQSPHLGRMHPISLIQMQIESIFQGMGFMVLTGFEVESEYYNFDALNIPADHPAREMQDTYWLTNGSLLRTHTSATQVRALESFGAPIRAIFPGRCYRYETIDASHENTFYQLEGLMVDRHITVANLIGVMKTVLEEIFEQNVSVRMRPGFFPFVEPGFELDLQCMLCRGKGCTTCKFSGWIELIPCGLVHPKVLDYGGVNSNKFSGFAFGLGLTRLAMMKFHIPDIRLFNCGDIRFYEQFTPVVV